MQRSRKKAIAITLEKQVFWALTSLLILLVVFYIYFLTASIFHVIVREEVEQNIIVLESYLGGLEAKYIKKKNTITLDLAYELDFHRVASKEFVNGDTMLSRRILGDKTLR
jgi:hypothetical protein